MLYIHYDDLLHIIKIDSHREISTFQNLQGPVQRLVSSRTSKSQCCHANLKASKSKAPV